jgi:hypothetical protein
MAGIAVQILRFTMLSRQSLGLSEPVDSISVASKSASISTKSGTRRRDSERVEIARRNLTVE